MGGAPEVALRCFGVLLEGILRERRGEGDGLMGGLREMGGGLREMGKAAQKLFPNERELVVFCYFFHFF